MKQIEDAMDEKKMAQHRSDHPFHDTEGTGKSGSSESFQEAAGSLPVQEWTSVR